MEGRKGHRYNRSNPVNEFPVIKVLLKFSKEMCSSKSLSDGWLFIISPLVCFVVVLLKQGKCNKLHNPDGIIERRFKLKKHK